MNPLLLNEVISSLTLVKTLLDDALIILNTIKQEEPLTLASYHLNQEAVEKRFSFPEELTVILSIAQDYFSDFERPPVNPYALLLAIREAEQGRKGLEFGIMHQKAKNTDLRTQAEWACATVRNTMQRFNAQNIEPDFIAFLGRRYAPVGAENDKEGLNQNWVRNVKFWYEKFSDG